MEFIPNVLVHVFAERMQNKTYVYNPSKKWNFFSFILRMNTRKMRNFLHLIYFTTL